MNMWENFKIALRGVNSNKLRSALTTLGVLIGVGAVIILLAVGTGSQAAVEAKIKALGTNTITIINRGRFGRGPAKTGTQSQIIRLRQPAVTAMSDPTQAPDIQSVSPVITSSQTATYNGATFATSVIGTTPSYLSADDYSIEAGQAITQAEVTNRTPVVDIGQQVLSNLFPAGSNPIGQSIELGSSTFQVIGVLNEKGASGTANYDSVAIAPYTAVQDQLSGESGNFSELLIQATSTNTLNAAAAEAENILASQNSTTVANLPFTIVNQGTLLSTAQTTSSTLTVLLGAVAAISLLVGGIGVMNIMLVTVTERTREIGIRKAIGAPKSVILTQFLFESVILSLFGGGAGILVGVIGSHFKIDGVYPVIAGYSIPLAFGVALCVGVFFGLYPANRAASLRPIDALRYE